MTTQIPASEMLPTKFEPLRNNRWIVKIDGIESWTVKTAEIPKIIFKDGEIKCLSPFKLEVYSAIEPSTDQMIVEFCKQNENKVVKAAVNYLDPAGTIVGKWELDVKLDHVDLGTLDYSDHGLMTRKLIFEVEKMTLCW